MATAPGVQYQIGANGAGCLVTACGYGGKVVGFSFSTSAATSSQAMQDHLAWVALENLKGVISSPFYGPSYSGLVASYGESVDWGNSLGSSATTANFTTVTANNLTSVYAGSASFTGSIAPSGPPTVPTLTVTAISTGKLQNSEVITGPGIAAGTMITGFNTASGGTGTYILNNNQTVASEPMTGFVGPAFTGIADGNDNASGYDLAETCQRKFIGMAHMSNLKFAVFHPRAHTLSQFNGTLGTPGGQDWPIPSALPDAAPVLQTAQDEALADVNGFARCSSAIRPFGWFTIYATAEQSDKPINSLAGQDVLNPIIRMYGRQFFDAIWDPDSDPRFGSDGAGSQTSNMTSCSNGSMYFQDPNNSANRGVHPTVCGHQVLAAQLTAVIADIMQRDNNPTGFLSSNVIQSYAQIDGIFSVSGGGTFTILPCGGLLSGVKMVTLTNTGSNTETVNASVEYNQGGQDMISPGISGAASSSTFPLAAGSTKTFKVYYDGVPGDACGFVAS